MTNQTITFGEATAKGLQQMMTHTMKIVGVSQLRKAALITELEARYVSAVEVLEDGSYTPVYAEVQPKEGAKKLRTTVDVFSALANVDRELVAQIEKAMVRGHKLSRILMNPTKYVDVALATKLVEFATNYDISKVVVPTRKMALVWATELMTAKLGFVGIEKQVIVAPRLELRAQNHVIDKVATKFVHIVRNEMTGEIEIVAERQVESLREQGKNVQQVIDMRYIMSIDYNLPILKGEKKLTREQLFLQSRAIINGVYFDFNGQMLNAEYFLSSASERRTVMGQHIVGKDAVETLHQLGYDFRQFAKLKDGVYKLDMIKAPNRFGLGSTSSINSRLVRIGNKVKDYANGSYALVGGTHTMLCVDDIYSYVKLGKYLAYNPETNSFEELDAATVPFKRNATDGMLFADASLQFTLMAEFGKLISAEQVRITPATKGLVVFVPGLKKMCGHDILAFDSALKGNYRTLVKTNPDFEIDFRIAIFAHNAKDDKKKTNLPYQMNQTIFTHEHMDELREKLDVELEEMFAVYDSPEKLSEYLGIKTLEVYDDIAHEDLTDEQREQMDNTLVSMFTNFFYAGELVMEDPYFKVRLIRIIENMIKAWTRGSLPIDGHYRFCSTDVYGVMTAYTEAMKGNTDFFDEDGKTIIVPSHVGIPANHVVMVDDEDKDYLENTTVILQRNPKISGKETAKATTFVSDEYKAAREQYSFAFNNLIMYSCHDFLTPKQGGMDFDGDKSHASADPVLVNAYKEQPALLDLTLVNGEYIEGCPFPVKGSVEAKTRAEFDFFGAKYRADVIMNGTAFNDEFTVTFTDEDYTMEFARKCHELSKVFVLRSLEPNRIGELTDYATKLLATISRLDWHLRNNVDVDGKVLDDEVRSFYKEEMAKMDVYVDILRLLQGWEIDKPKHGGAFWTALESQLRFITDPDFYPVFASEYVRYGKFETRKYSALEWHKSVRTQTPLLLQDGKVYPSLMQELRSHVLMSFIGKVKSRFAEMDPSTDTHNLITRLAPYANVTDLGMVSAVTALMVPIFKEYGKAMLESSNARKRFMVQRESMTFYSKHDARLYDRRMEFELNALVDKAINTARTKVKALPFDEKTVAYIAYAKKYSEYRPSKAGSTASGLSFAWIVCQDGMLELVALASGRKMNHIPFSDIQSAPVTIRMTSFEVAPDRAKELFESSSRTFVWYHMDDVTGNYLPFVYVGKTRVAVLAENSSYYFTGTDKFEFFATNFETSVSGRSASMVLAPQYNENCEVVREAVIRMMQ